MKTFEVELDRSKDVFRRIQADKFFIDEKGNIRFLKVVDTITHQARVQPLEKTELVAVFATSMWVSVREVADLQNLTNGTIAWRLQPDTRSNLE